MRGSDSFAVLLRHRRRAACLTQEELAERAHLSARTVSDLERGLNLRPRRDSVALLAEALALTVTEREEFEGAARRTAPRGPASAKSLDPDGESALAGDGELSRHGSPTNLPRALTSFVGREREQAAIVNLLAKAPLLTLTGAGGCGKTRLALRVAGECLAFYPDGVLLVELAPLASPALVPQAVAAALGVYEEPGRPLIATLTAFLRPRRLLLVLDNCEHLVAACADLATALLQACPRLQILATSREALGIAGEQTWKVPSLSLPDPQQLPTPAWLIEAEAVRLFLQRARTVHPAFALTERNGDLIAQVCRRLDGIPLAIELAAARLSALSLENLADRLDDRFRLLTGGSRTALPRQQTLRAALDWSYALLDEAERTLLRRLAVFAGGWTLEAAEAVCVGEEIEGEAVVDLMIGLVNKSLVVLDQAEDTGERGGRYQLLETVRQYALEQLVASGEATSVRGRHLDWSLALAGGIAPGRAGPYQAGLDRLEGELDNLRAALRWAREAAEASGGLRLAQALESFWDRHGYRSEGLQWLEEFLALCPQGGATSLVTWNTLRARALYSASWLAFMQTEIGVAKELGEQGLALFRALEDPTGLAAMMEILGCVARDEGDFGRAEALLEESTAQWRALENTTGLSGALFNLAMTMLQQGDPIRAISLAQESINLEGDRRGEWSIAIDLLFEGQLAWEQGDLNRAQALGEETLALFRKAGDRRFIALTLGYVLGQVAREQGDLARATALCEESLALGRDLGDGGVIGWASLGLGLATCEQGDFVRARMALVEGLSLFGARGMKWFMARCLAGLAQVAAREGQAEQAARLTGATEALLALMGAPLPRGERAGYESAVVTARNALGDDCFNVAWAAGQALPLGEAVAEALEDSARLGNSRSTPLIQETHDSSRS